MPSKSSRSRSAAAPRRALREIRSGPARRSQNAHSPAHRAGERSVRDQYGALREDFLSKPPANELRGQKRGGQNLYVLPADSSESLAIAKGLSRWCSLLQPLIVEFKSLTLETLMLSLRAREDRATFRRVRARLLQLLLDLPQ